MQKKQSSRSLVFTHWDPAVYEHYFNLNDFIIEVIWSGLLYDHIYLRDSDLAVNAHLAEFLLRENSLDIFRKLLETGFIKIHSMKKTWYPDHLQELAEKKQ